MEIAKRTVREMYLGLLCWGIVLLLPVFFVPNKIPYISGVITGCLAAVFLLIHMYKHIDIALDMDKKSAEAYMRRTSLARTLIMALVVGGSVYLGRYVHPAGVVLGIFGMKVSAYMQPVIHKYIGEFLTVKRQKK